MSRQQVNSAPASPVPLSFKVVLLGEIGVGKSSLVLRFAQGKFPTDHEATIGAAFFTQTLEVSNTSVKFEIWDTAGQERYHSLAPMYLRNAQAAVVVYDVTQKHTFERAKTWVKQIRQQDNNDTIAIALAGNKCDLCDTGIQRQITREEAQGYADEFKLLFLETSARSAINVDNIFLDLATRAVQMTTPDSRRAVQTLVQPDQDTEPASGCC